ncbi:MAG TPA: hypothetical protein VIG32_08600 [Candidatus Baltobacteraceae bacterium]|jgi:hypothetical protein
MNKYTLQTLVAAALLAGAPAGVAASPSNAATYYTTQFVQLYGSPGPYSGTLQLRISPDNIISGYYRAEDGQGPFVTVTGGRSGKDIWLDIGPNGAIQIRGSLERGKIVGTAIDETATEYRFTATPEDHPLL